MKKYKIVDGRRFTLFLVITLSLIFLLISIMVNSIKAQGVNLKDNYQEHYVLEGETIWDIALKYKPGKYDVRDMVYEIKRYNKLNTSYIFPGDLIKIPSIEK